jgi:ferric-dicitrate binding protein FerR (iron transport regulator)
MRNHLCPNCKSFAVHKSRKRGLFETVAAKVFFLQPFRCHACFRRHYRFALPRSVTPRRNGLELRVPRNESLILQRIGIVFAMVSASILLAHSGQVIEALGTDGRGLFSTGDRFFSASSLLPVAPSQARPLQRAARELPVLPVSRLPVGNRANPLGQVVNASLSTMDGNALVPDEAVYSGDVISAGNGGAALVGFPQKGEATLAEATSVRFIGEGGSIVAEILSGNLQVASQANQAFFVQTSQYRIAPQGTGKTEFRVKVAAGQRTTIETQLGTVAITRLGSGESVSLARGLSAEVQPSDNGISDQAAGRSPEIGTVVSSVATTRDGAAISDGSVIANEDSLTTGATGSAVVQLSPESRVTLGENTLAQFTKTVERVWVRLKSGQVVTDSTGETWPVVSTPRFYVEPASQAHSVIFVQVMTDNSTYIESDAGDVKIEEVQSGKTYVLAAGDRAFVPANSSGIPGLEPQAPVRAAAAPPRTPPQTQPPSHPQPASGPTSTSHKTLLVLGIAAAAGTAGTVAALAAGGGAQPPVASPSVPQ